MTPQRRHPVQYPDINKPVPVLEVRDLRIPLPEKPTTTRSWEILNRKPDWQKWVRKERQA